jgi:hypothetical protein
MRKNNYTTLFILSLLLLEAITIITTTAAAFVHVPNTIGSPVFTTKSSVLLFAAATKKKNNNKKKSGGGGFGISGTTKSLNNGSGDGGTTSTTTAAKLIAAADKNSLEQKWDAFASITDLEIKPIGSRNPEEDDNYEHFEVVDVFVRSGSGSTTSSGDDNDSKTSDNSNTGWYRIGKVCAVGIEFGGTTSIEAALVLQKGLILWTSVHMRRELMAKGSSAASSLELGYISPPILYMGCDTDKPIDDDEVQQHLKIVDKKLLPAEELSKVKSNTYGFRPDWNPPGFTYKRREKAAMKKKNSKKKKTLEEILDE